MLLRSLAPLLIASTASLFFAMDADASSRFNIRNESDTKIRVKIFNGSDSECSIPLKTKKVAPGETVKAKCRGEGHHRCKVQVFANGKQICRSSRNTCRAPLHFKAMTVPDGGRVYVKADVDCW